MGSDEGGERGATMSGDTSEARRQAASQMRSAACLVAAAIATTVMTASPAQAQAVREISHCGDETQGEMVVRSPQPVTYTQKTVIVVLEIRCKGGINFLVGVDGVGYSEDGHSLVADPKANPGCGDSSDCWPSLTAAADDSWTSGVVRYSLELERGKHHLVVRSALGTRPPSFLRS
jgi:hypothetical protein